MNDEESNMKVFPVSSLYLVLSRHVINIYFFCFVESAVTSRRLNLIYGSLKMAASAQSSSLKVL